MALAIPEAFGETAGLFGVSYLVVNVVHTGLFLAAGPHAMVTMRRLGPLNITSALLVLAGGLLPSRPRYVLGGRGRVADHHAVSAPDEACAASRRPFRRNGTGWSSSSRSASPSSRSGWASPAFPRDRRDRGGAARPGHRVLPVVDLLRRRRRTAEHVLAHITDRCGAPGSRCAAGVTRTTSCCSASCCGGRGSRRRSGTRSTAWTGRTRSPWPAGGDVPVRARLVRRHAGPAGDGAPGGGGRWSCWPTIPLGHLVAVAQLAAIPLIMATAAIIEDVPRSAGPAAPRSAHSAAPRR